MPFALGPDRSSLASCGLSSGPLRAKATRRNLARGRNSGRWDFGVALFGDLLRPGRRCPVASESLLLRVVGPLAGDEVGIAGASGHLAPLHLAQRLRKPSLLTYAPLAFRRLGYQVGRDLLALRYSKRTVQTTAMLNRALDPVGHLMPSLASDRCRRVRIPAWEPYVSWDVLSGRDANAKLLRPPLAFWVSRLPRKEDCSSSAGSQPFTDLCCALDPRRAYCPASCRRGIAALRSLG